MQSNTLGMEGLEGEGVYLVPHRPLNRSRSICSLDRQYQSSSKSERDSEDGSIRSKIKKASAHQFVREVENLEASHKRMHAHSLPLMEELSPDKVTMEDKDIFLKSRIHDELQIHLQHLEREEQGQGEDLEDLEYTTFRIIKREERAQLSELKQKLAPKPDFPKRC